jgi:hypothetical protein
MAGSDLMILPDIGTCFVSSRDDKSDPPAGWFPLEPPDHQAGQVFRASARGRLGCHGKRNLFVRADVPFGFRNLPPASLLAPRGPGSGRDDGEYEPYSAEKELR